MKDERRANAGERKAYAAVLLTHCVISCRTAPPPMPLSRRSLVATVLTAASIPVAVGSLLWHAALRRRDLMVDFDPFEIDLQLHERNDEPRA